MNSWTFVHYAERCVKNYVSINRKARNSIIGPVDVSL